MREISEFSKRGNFIIIGNIQEYPELHKQSPYIFTYRFPNDNVSVVACYKNRFYEVRHLL